jgi:hypothetical protein
MPLRREAESSVERGWHRQSAGVNIAIERIFIRPIVGVRSTGGCRRLFAVEFSANY